MVAIRQAAARGGKRHGCAQGAAGPGGRGEVETPSAGIPSHTPGLGTRRGFPRLTLPGK